MPVDLSPILKALADYPGAIAAWEIDDVDDPTLSVFDVSGAPRQLLYVSPERAEQREVSARLAAAGHPTALYAIGTGVVWCGLPAAFEVWATVGVGLIATAHDLGLRDGTRLDRASVSAVVPHTDADTVARRVSLRTDTTEYVIAPDSKHTAAYRGDYEDGGSW